MSSPGSVGGSADTECVPRSRVPAAQRVVVVPVEHLAVGREFFADGTAWAAKTAGPVNHQILTETPGEWFICCEESLDAWMRRLPPEHSGRMRHRLGATHRAHRAGLDPRVLRSHLRLIRDLLDSGCSWELLDALLPTGAVQERVRLYSLAGLTPAEALDVEQNPTPESLDGLRLLAGLRDRA